MDRIRHAMHARAFLKRARVHLATFDEESDAPAIFYAALELRLGIEARLFAYLKPTMRQLGRGAPTGYQATKLLAKLKEMNPKAEQRMMMRWTNGDTGEASPWLGYTPVTPELASDHGRLGNLLHFEYFEKNPYWFLPMRSKGSPRSFVDWRDYLEGVAGRLEEACSGTLLTHATFTTIVEETESEEP